MPINPSIFRAYDIRGIYPGELDEKAAYQIGRAFAIYLLETETEKPEKIVVGQDARLSSPVLTNSFISGVIDEGIDVLNIGQVTVDMVFFASGSMHIPAAMITASHNPKEYNGFKLMRKNADEIGLDLGLSDIKKIVLEKNWPESANDSNRDIEQKRGIVMEEDISADFINHVLSFIDPESLRPMRIAIDASSGVVGPILTKILKKLPVEYTPLYFNPDGNFPYHEPNPTIESNIAGLISEVRNGHYHFGCAFDGDGDRIVFVDEGGEPVSPSIIGAIMARQLLVLNPGGKIVYGAVVSQIVPDIVNVYGGEAVRERVGTYIKERLKKVNGILGIETSGHYYFRNNFFADSGIIGFLVMIDILSRKKKSLSVLKAQLSKYVSITEINFKVVPPRGISQSEKNSEAFLKKIAQNFEGYDMDWLDGLTVRTEDFWLNIRPSNTEPLIRLNIEAKDELVLERIKKDILALIGRTV
ncbi:MAG: phosphomannomutase/phosphoglucomutase [Candidatus Azambacteria bacterium]|nr:phosphomannomutase/phosphoglucomutase [Candidatus Azambacteria bacterium]